MRMWGKWELGRTTVRIGMTVLSVDVALVCRNAIKSCSTLKTLSTPKLKQKTLIREHTIYYSTCPV